MTTPPSADVTAYMPFAYNAEHDLTVSLEHHAGRSVRAVKDSILAAARREGFGGTIDERLKELGWWIEPVYRRTTDERVARLVEAAEEAANDLEAEIEHRRAGELPRRIDRDLQTVRDLRAAIAAYRAAYEPNRATVDGEKETM